MRMFPIMILQYRDPDKNTCDVVRAKNGHFVVVGMPWDMLAEHGTQAQTNHGQTLQQLADRGGLSAAEALDILDGNRWGECHMMQSEANEELARRVSVWLAEHLSSLPSYIE